MPRNGNEWEPEEVHAVRNGVPPAVGNNSFDIWGFPYDSLPYKAQNMIYKILNLTGRSEDVESWSYFSERDGVTEFQNHGGDLPEPRGRYTEWTVETPNVSGPGPRRIVLDTDDKNSFYIFYYTAIHYGKDKLDKLSFIGTVARDKRNAFYKVTGIPDSVKRGKNVV